MVLYETTAFLYEKQGGGILVTFVANCPFDPEKKLGELARQWITSTVRPMN